MVIWSAIRSLCVYKCWPVSYSSRISLQTTLYYQSSAPEILSRQLLSLSVLSDSQKCSYLLCRCLLSLQLLLAATVMIAPDLFLLLGTLAGILAISLLGMWAGINILIWPIRLRKWHWSFQQWIKRSCLSSFTARLHPMWTAFPWRTRMPHYSLSLFLRLTIMYVIHPSNSVKSNSDIGLIGSEGASIYRWLDRFPVVLV